MFFTFFLIYQSWERNRIIWQLNLSKSINYYSMVYFYCPQKKKAVIFLLSLYCYSEQSWNFMVEAVRRWLYILKKALLDALNLNLRNLAVPKHLSNIKATMTSMCMLYPTYDLQTTIISCLHFMLFIYILAWASALLVSTNGRCQSLWEWDEWQGDSHASFMYNLIHILIIAKPWESVWKYSF